MRNIILTLFCALVFGGDSARGGNLCGEGPTDPSFIKVVERGDKAGFLICERRNPERCMQVGKSASYPKAALEKVLGSLVARHPEVGTLMFSTQGQESEGAQALSALSVGAPVTNLKSVDALRYRPGDREFNLAITLGAALAKSSPGACQMFRASTRDVSHRLQEGLRMALEKGAGAPSAPQ